MVVVDTSTPPRAIEGAEIRSAGWLAGLGAAAGLGALISSSCCVLPLMLAGFGATTIVFSGLEALTILRPFLLGGAGLALLAAWALFFWRRSTACRSDGACTTANPSKRTAMLLGLGSLFLALSFVWESAIEPILLKIVR